MAETAVVVKDMRDTLRQANMRAAIQAVLPRGVSPDKIIGTAIMAVNAEPSLLKCTKDSVMRCVMLAAQLGLEIGGPLGHCYLVPFRGVATFIPGYRGLVTLAVRSGKVLGVQARAVYEGDEFHVFEGTEQKIVHRPLVNRDPKAECTHVYVVFEHRGGVKTFDWMTRAETDVIKGRVAARCRDGVLSGPWKTDEVEMMKKTVVRRGSKMEMLSPEWAAAVDADERAERGESQDAVLAHLTPPSDDPPPATSQTEALRERLAKAKGAGSGPQKAPDDAPPQGEPGVTVEGEVAQDDPMEAAIRGVEAAIDGIKNSHHWKAWKGAHQAEVDAFPADIADALWRRYDERPAKGFTGK